MKIASVLLLLYFVFFVNRIARPIDNLKGRVTQKESSEPIPYTNIYLLNGNYGIVSDELGYFIWNWPINKSDTLVISAIGYKSLFIPAARLLNTSNVEIDLEGISYNLPEVIVKKTNETYWLGSKLLDINNTGFGECVNSTYEVVLLLKEDESRSGLLSKVGYFISDWGEPRTPFRVRLYKNNEGVPGEEIIFGNLIAIAKSGGKWFDVDLSNYHIDFPGEGVFVGMEWLVMQDEKYYYNIQFRYHPEEKAEKRRCFGQKLGVTYEYDKPLGWIRRNFKQWKPFVQNPHKKSINNPMIRAEIKI